MNVSMQDGDALMAMLTFPDQEERVVARVRSKAATFGQDMDEEGCAPTAFAHLLLILILI